MTNYTHFASYSGIFFRKSQSFMKSAFKDIGLTFIDCIVLINACENPGIIQEKIASNLALDDAAVARSLKNMELKSLIKREFDSKNLRIKKVYAEQLGEEYKFKIDQIMNFWNSVILGEFTAKEREDIISSLHTLQKKALNINIDETIASMKEKLGY